MNKYDFGEAIVLGVAIVTLIFQALHYDPMSLAPSLIACTMTGLAIVFDNKSEEKEKHDTDESNKSKMP